MSRCTYFSVISLGKKRFDHVITRCLNEEGENAACKTEIENRVRDNNLNIIEASHTNVPHSTPLDCLVVSAFQCFFFLVLRFMWVQAFIHDCVFSISIPPKAIQFVVCQRVWFCCYLFVSSWREQVLLIHTFYMILVRAHSFHSAPVLLVFFFSPWHSLSIRKCWWMCNNVIKVCATNNLCALFHIVIMQSKRFFRNATIWFYNARALATNARLCLSFEMSLCLFHSK